MLILNQAFQNLFFLDANYQFDFDNDFKPIPSVIALIIYKLIKLMIK